MRGIGIAALVILAAAPAAASPRMLTLLPGIYTNEEDIHIASEGHRTPPDYVAISVTREGDQLRLREVDRFGKSLEDGHLMKVVGNALIAGPCEMPFRVAGGALTALPRSGRCHNTSVMSRISALGITLTLPDGGTTVLRRARTATCWGAVLKPTRKPDGSEDWYRASDLKLHDQGGRVAFGGGDTGAPPVIVRMRNVIRPSGPNQPSLVLYVSTAEEPDRAISDSWADPDAKRIGINLRWMQASCSIDTPGGGK